MGWSILGGLGALALEVECGGQRVDCTHLGLPLALRDRGARVLGQDKHVQTITKVQVGPG